MKPVTLLGFAAWFALLGFLLGAPAGVILTWNAGREWQWAAVLAASVAALIVVRIATGLKVRMTKANRVEGK